MNNDKKIVVDEKKDNQCSEDTFLTLTLASDFCSKIEELQLDCEQVQDGDELTLKALNEQLRVAKMTALYHRECAEMKWKTDYEERSKSDHEWLKKYIR